MDALTTKEQALEMYLRDPNLRQKEIAKSLGVSRQRISQILVFNKINARQSRSRLNKIQISKTSCVCVQCHKSFRFQDRFKKVSRYKYCSRDCYLRFKYVVLTCCVCSDLFPKRRAEYAVSLRRTKSKNKKWYCSKECFGKELGLKFGRYSYLKKPIKNTCIHGHMDYRFYPNGLKYCGSCNKIKRYANYHKIPLEKAREVYKR